MSRKIIVTCPDCGVVLKRHERKSHSKLYCPANGAPAKQHRKCAHRKCDVQFVPKPGNPQQAYCGKTCWRNEKYAKRAELWQRNKVNAPEDEAGEEAKEEAHMAPFHRREEELAEQAAQYVPVMGEALYETTMRLMRAA